MRGTVPGLASPHPLGLMLPGLYQDDDLAQRFTSALDSLLAPLLATLDGLTAYVDPALAPEDFLPGLAHWVGVSLDEGWPVARRRLLIASAAELYRWQGTRRGIARLVEVYTGVMPELVDTGGVTSSTTARPRLRRGSGPPGLTVRLPRGADVEPARVQALVESAAPAHVTVTVEVAA